MVILGCDLMTLWFVQGCLCMCLWLFNLCACQWVYSPFTPAITETTDLLQNLSLDSQSDALEVTNPAKMVGSPVFYWLVYQFIGNSNLCFWTYM